MQPEELRNGKGKTTCGNEICAERSSETHEVFMKYTEDEQEKSALVKVHLCAKCAEKLNYQVGTRKGML